ncbi:hypothetical protein [Rhizobium sp. 18065]|uniref:hypothetical protein n=1 Tax=Rhizobium sp. 18065 TaxID=2681411 RepID=UPI0013592273|nr:hypothetical protein [Rhizobium sp. 18065]
MAKKELASATAAADLATASEAGIKFDVETLPDGQAVAISSTGEVQGESVPAEGFREVIEYPVPQKDGSFMTLLIRNR